MPRQGFVAGYDPAGDALRFRQTHEGFPEYTGVSLGVNTFIAGDGTRRFCDGCNGVPPPVQPPTVIVNNDYPTPLPMMIASPEQVVAPPNQMVIPSISMPANPMITEVPVMDTIMDPIMNPIMDIVRPSFNLSSVLTPGLIIGLIGFVLIIMLLTRRKPTQVIYI